MVKVKAGQLMIVAVDYAVAYSYESLIKFYPKINDPVVVLKEQLAFEGSSINCLWGEKIVAIPFYCLKELKQNL